MHISIDFLTAGRQQAESSTEIRLGYRETYQQDGDLRGVRVIALEGQVWVTQPGDPDDHILGPGERFTITRPGLVVVQGMSPALFRMIEV